MQSSSSAEASLTEKALADNLTSSVKNGEALLLTTPPAKSSNAPTTRRQVQSNLLLQLVAPPATALSWLGLYRPVSIVLLGESVNRERCRSSTEIMGIALSGESMLHLYCIAPL